VAANWSGFYVGLHGGYGWADLDDNDDNDDVFDDADLEGAVIGGQLGMNFQYNMFVFGIEGDASWSGIDLDDDFDFDDGDEFDEDFELGYDWLASVRGRLGLGFDRFLVYGTGGVGFADFDDGGFDDDILDDDDDDDNDDVQVGWVAGGGAEFLLTDNVSLGAEYLHYEFDDTFDDEDLEIDSSVDVIRGRVNVKFGSLFGG
jgi:outer membrane immunogenic protein